jgi:hypothetical protein
MSICAAHLRYDCPPGSFRRNYPAFAATSFLDELRATTRAFVLSFFNASCDASPA